MKRLLILGLALALLFCACGTAIEPPEDPAIEATTVVTTTEETTTEPQKTDAKPFTKDDITAIEAQFETVGDYVKAVPAAWYKIDHWDANGCEIYIMFFDHEDSSPFLRLQTHDESLCEILENKSYELTQDQPKILLEAKKVEIRSIDFAEAGNAITPPRGIKVGDPAQKINNEYPDYRVGDSHVLYDITTLYPEAKPEWGKWDGEGWSNIDFLGGGIMEGGVGFTFVNPPWGWDERENDYTWLNMYNPRYLLTYQVENDFITGIEYRLLYHPG